LLSISFLQFPTIRKNTRREAEAQMYARIMEATIELDSRILKHLQKWQWKAQSLQNVSHSSILRKSIILMSFIDLIEFLHRLNKTEMINAEVWSRWKALSRTMMTIPKFKTVWDKTKDIHTSEFRHFIDSL
ncbi:MAG: hypothetical protein WA364_09940, partial [Candidatus Nitrosopolaris sp.]